MSNTNSAVNGMVRCDVRLDGKTAVITGANSGVGYETALDLAGRGARVIMACRDVQKGEEAKQKIPTKIGNGEIEVKKLDLASLASVREFAKEINENEQRLDILVNNAGIMTCPPWKTKDGFEMQLGTNHIGHFLLTQLLLDLLKNSAPSRIIVVSSVAYKYGTMNWDDIMQEKNYKSTKAYAASKLANVHHCTELSRRLEGTGVTCNVLHPGVVATNLDRHMEDTDHMSFLWRMLFKMAKPILRSTAITPKQGAQTSIYCAIAPELNDVSGKYFDKCAEETLLAHAQKREDAERLWKLSEDWIKEDQ